MDARPLLSRFLELADGSTQYFVSGSFSFLPRLQYYRDPDHDLDVAIESGSFLRIQKHLRSNETIHVLSLADLAVAEGLIIPRFLPARTSFVHVDTPAGLLDFAHYRLSPRALSFRLGPGLRLSLPHSVLDRVETLTWHGCSYRAGPPELAFIPKLIAFRRRPNALPSRHVEDLRRLAAIVDRSFLTELAQFRGLRFLGRPLLRLLDPFVSLADLAGETARATA
jgi:hypothetical protein